MSSLIQCQRGRALLLALIIPRNQKQISQKSWGVGKVGVVNYQNIFCVLDG